MVKIVIDMMGGDNGSKATVGGVLKFLKNVNDCEVVAVGDPEELKKLEGKCQIIPASEVVPMECSAMEAMRRKESSVYKAVSAVLSEQADAVVSAGSTGAFLSLSTLLLKKIEGISRPALITPFPTKVDGKYVVLLDVGASSENNANELYQFAKMGEAYYRVVYGKDDLNTYLISNGSEEGKGTPLSREAYDLLKADPNFKGYIEGRYVFGGDADVVVFDGFTGNVFLKGSEGLAKMLGGMMKDAFTANLSSKIGWLFAKRGFKKMLDKMDYKKVGGALLLGVNAISVKAHGNSNEDSFYHSIMIAYTLAKGQVVEQIKESLQESK